MSSISGGTWFGINNGPLITPSAVPQDVPMASEGKPNWRRRQSQMTAPGPPRPGLVPPVSTFFRQQGHLWFHIPPPGILQIRLWGLSASAHLGPNNATLGPDLLINIAVDTLFRVTSVPLQRATPKQTASYIIPTSQHSTHIHRTSPPQSQNHPFHIIQQHDPTQHQTLVLSTPLSP